ncbi:PD-(D/E)XK motif protein [Paractinoplanes maris]|uniref:PD-(D/E)XK motif protein n=1 Tax=Paractinoplanes maris TaxID=1734446 RepID=UPI00201FB966|nr:PD-(D/E)XK motif protein [Actinoplanes maris]
MSAPIAERHLSREALADYLAGAPAAIGVPGNPRCRIDIDPPRREMALRTPHDGQEPPDLSLYEYVEARVVRDEGAEWTELLIRYGDSEYEAYLLLSDIADLIQQDGLPFGAAVRSSLTTFGDLLTRVGSLSAEKQTGLYGEMLFLESCIREVGPGAAVPAWKGFARNEHDFVFPGACFEVKTTRTESRRHTIGSLEQLQPTPGTPLWLVSIQITAATPVVGRSLAGLIDDVRTAAGPEVGALDISLGLAGWRERDRPLYQDCRRLRSAATAYEVDGGFPVLNRAVIQRGCAQPSLIVGASYAIDVTTLEPGRPPSPGDAFVTGSAT